MKQAVSEKDVLNLLSGLKTMGGNYPSDMIQSRRDLYIKQAAAMAVLTKTSGNGSGGGTNAGGGGGMAATGGAGAVGSLSLGKFLETALVVAIAVEAGVAAYIYRDKIANFIDSNILPKVEVAANPTEDYSGTPDILSVTGTETPTVTVTETDTPSISNDAAPENNNNSSIQESLSTPTPTDNPGNHYGNTPKPERTKDTTNNTNNNSKETKDKIKD